MALARISSALMHTVAEYSRMASVFSVVFTGDELSACASDEAGSASARPSSVISPPFSAIAVQRIHSCIQELREVCVVRHTVDYADELLVLFLKLLMAL
jgi:hypothetical protein